MKWFVLFIGLGLVSSAQAETLHDKLEHDLAHFGAGAGTAWLVHQFDDGLSPWQQLGIEAGSALAINLVYKTAMHEWQDPQALERMVCGTGGGLINFNFKIHWYSTRR